MSARNLVLVLIGVFQLCLLLLVVTFGFKDWSAALSVCILFASLLVVMFYNIAWRPRHDPVRKFFAQKWDALTTRFY